MLTDFGHLAPSFYLHPFTFLLLPSSLLTGLAYVLGPRKNYIKNPRTISRSGVFGYNVSNCYVIKLFTLVLSDCSHIAATA
jgi:hypothetical protein